MNQSELIALNGALSNEARVLYCLGLRPDADNTTGLTKPLNYRKLLALLNSKQPLLSLGRHINQLLRELADAGLVDSRDECISSRSLNGQQLLLPLVVASQTQYQTLHLHWQCMSVDWRPNQRLFDELSQLVGLLDNQYSDEDVGEFIAYWLSRPEISLTQFQWTQRFVLQLKKSRLTPGSRHKIGQQFVSATPGVAADENAKKLVEKYSAKPKG
ncbi:flavodoxin [Bowmanella sp. Y26]|uniref:Flavodoxin n=1 Tax=Bowmanella yangjiangensis TaxID=2811230 RepID=A0ABS3CXH1_9ALTE|nr:DnaT-like ssDNA-binding domain-containing protein [Bowmanella yangjiangensis]MBN7821822.1 flavodoxin [Bowmanella yangjiangensis]MBT1063852.1 flavodoxin [Bowmanella yangjiangensis]